MRRILKPHKEQDGYIYCRFKRKGWVWDEAILDISDGLVSTYNDRLPNSRTISSRKVEEAVETWEYLQRCVEEGLEVLYHHYSWYVQSEDYEGDAVLNPGSSQGDTLREAYGRHHQKVKDEA